MGTGRIVVLGSPDAVRLLRAEGFKVDETLQDAGEPDAVVIDAGLPGAGEQLQRLTRGLGLPVVVVADSGGPEEMRRALVAGARDYLVRPYGADELARAVHEACAHRASLPRGRLFVVAGAKGGVGRTALAAHLAVALARPGIHVTAADLDLEFGGLAAALGMAPQSTIGDLGRVSGTVNASVIGELCAPVTGMNLRILAAPRHPVEAADAAPKVGEVLDTILGVSEFVVADLARDLGEATLAALDRAAAVLVVLTPDPTALAATLRLTRILRDDLHYPQERLRVVCNQTLPQPVLAPRAIEQPLGGPPAVFVPYDPEVPLAQAAGRPLTARRRRSGYTDAVVSLAAALTAAGQEARASGG